jgi:two-component system cell cycle response regulator DivK
MTTLLRNANDRSATSPMRRRATSVKPLVLVVEDHEDTRFLLTQMLEMKGYRVSVATDGEDGVRAAECDRPDLILMDASLPRLDGLAATRRIRELSALHDVPIIFLSGHVQASFRALALETGCNDYLTKPFELAQLDGILQRHLGKQGAAKAE